MKRRFIAILVFGISAVIPFISAAGAADKLTIGYEPERMNSAQMFMMKRDGQEIRPVLSYINLNRNLLSAGVVVGALHLQFDLDADFTLFQINTEENKQLVTLNLKTGEYRTASGSGQAQEDELFIHNNELYIDSGLLAKLLNIDIRIDQAAGILELPKQFAQAPLPDIIKPDTTKEETVSAPPEEAIKKKADVAEPVPETPQPSAALPVPQIPLEAAAQAESSTPLKTEPEQAVIEKVPEAKIASAAENEGEEESLVLQPVIRNNNTSNIFIEAYRIGSRVYVDLKGVMEFLEFYLKVSPDGTKAEGWYVSSKNKFLLDRPAGKVQSGDKISDLSQEDTLWRDDILFANINAIEEWLPLKFSLDEKVMQLRILPEVELPSEIRKQREKQWQQLRLARERLPKDLPVLEDHYTAARLPFVDVDVSSNYNSQGNPSQLNSYTVQSSGDVGYHTLNSFVNGSSNDGLQSARFSAEKQDVNGGLLGALGATQYHLGDIDSGAIPMVAQTGLGRGMSVSNRPLGYLPDFDSKTFVGDATPGWEVELYRNGVLVEFQTVDAQGRYRFENIPILFGRNLFTLRFYGPQGQIEERTETVFAQQSLLKKGDMQYSLSMDEKGKELFGLADIPSYGEGARLVSSADYGFGENVTAGTFFSHLPLEDGTNHDYTGFRVRGLVKEMLVNADTAMDMAGDGKATRVSALGSLGDYNLRASQEFSDGLYSETDVNQFNLRTSSSELGLNTQISLPFLKDFNVNLSTEHNSYESAEDEYLTELRLGKSLFGLSTTQSLQYRQQESEFLDYELGLQGRIRKIFWRVLADMHVQPEAEMQDINLATQYRIASNLLGNTQLIHHFDADTSTFAYHAFTWELNDYRLSLFGQADNQGEFSLGLNIGISFGFLPDGKLYKQARSMAGQGGVIGNVFLDENYDGVMNTNEKPVENATIKVDGRSNRYAADPSIAVPLSTYNDVKVEVDESSIKNPFWRSATAGYTVMPLPGHFVQTNFPVVSTSEIDGLVVIAQHPESKVKDSTSQENADTEEDAESSAPSSAPIGGIILNLVDEKGKKVNEVLTEFDGFYVFEKVLPGTYMIEVEPNHLKTLHLKQLNIPKVLIEQESDFYSDQTITLEIMPHEKQVEKEPDQQ